MTSLSVRDQKVIWHPYTQHQTEGAALGISRGLGSTLYTDDGRKLIDAISSWWVTLHGHAHPYIAEKISNQLLKLEQVIFAGFTHEPAVRLAERLLIHLPENQARIFYSDNGSTAVEVALKMALQYWRNEQEQRQGFIAFKNSYHGDTFGAMSASGRGTFTAPFNDYLFPVQHIDIPSLGNEERSLEQLAAILNTSRPAAIIFEPLVLGAGGMQMYSPLALDKILKRCRQAHVLCIADEIMTGFGRTGSFFASDLLETKPDIICLSKGLSGGFLALGATSCSEEIYLAFLAPTRERMFFHGHSFTANCLACTAALASLDLMEQSDTQEAIKRISAQHQKFVEVLMKYETVENPRCQGTILAFELKCGADGGYLSNVRDQIIKFYLEEGVLIRPLGNTIYFLPPYCISAQELEQVYEATRRLLSFKALNFIVTKGKFYFS